jgi:hypothetical protein
MKLKKNWVWEQSIQGGEHSSIFCSYSSYGWDLSLKLLRCFAVNYLLWVCREFWKTCPGLVTTPCNLDKHGIGVVFWRKFSFLQEEKDTSHNNWKELWIYLFYLSEGVNGRQTVLSEKGGVFPIDWELREVFICKLEGVFVLF